MTRPSGLSLRGLFLRGITILIAAPFIVAACSSAADDTSSTSPTGVTSVATDTPVATDAPASAADTWRDIELTDVATGETFTLASLEGQPVAIEPMAVWCTNCKIQADNVKAASAELAAAGVRYISLGVDPNESPGTLSKYAQRGGYDWTFAPSPVEMSRALNDLFGPQVLAVPSTPLIVLDGSGEIVLLDFGFQGPDALVKTISEVTA